MSETKGEKHAHIRVSLEVKAGIEQQVAQWRRERGRHPSKRKWFEYDVVQAMWQCWIKDKKGSAGVVIHEPVAPAPVVTPRMERLRELEATGKVNAQIDLLLDAITLQVQQMRRRPTSFPQTGGL